MVSLFYTEQISCPHCQTSFTVQKVRASRCLVLERESDFNLRYQDVHPLWYSIQVCPQCHYAASVDSFSIDLNDNEKARITKGLELLRKEEPDFGGERSPEVALRSMELAIRTVQLKQAAPENFASLFLKAAWICRYLAKQELEQEYLQQALKYYIQAFEQGRSVEGKNSALRQMYMVGELHRRLGLYNQAVQWFSRLVVLPEIKDEPLIGRLARQQWQLAKDEAKEAEADRAPETAKAKGLGIEPVPKGSSSPAKALRPRTKIKASFTIYQYQWEFLQKASNAIYSESKVLVEKEAVVRAFLDALISLNPDLTGCSSEETLKEKIMNLIKR